MLRNTPDIYIHNEFGALLVVGAVNEGLGYQNLQTQDVLVEL